MTSFLKFAEVCRQIEHISSSLEMTRVVSDFFSSVDEEELEIVSRFIMGLIFPIWSPLQLGIGPNLLYSAVSRASGRPIKEIIDLVRDTGDVGLATNQALTRAKSTQSTIAAFGSEESGLSIKEVYSILSEIAGMSGKGSQTAKVKHIQYLFNLATSEENIYLARLTIEELRIGVGEGIVRDAIASAFDIPRDAVERAYMLTNDLGVVASQAKMFGLEGIGQLKIELGRPIKMMLAQVSQGIESAVKEIGYVAVEWKLDGARVQIHKNGDDIRIFSRRLENVTDSLPDIVNMVREGVTAKSALLDGEAVVLGQNGKPGAFQEILKRFRRKYEVEAMKGQIPLQLYLFDVLYINDESLFDLPLTLRRERLVEIIKSSDNFKVAEQLVTNDISVINNIYNQALENGHEGVMLKNPESSYTPGKRGKNWLKVKPLMETLDLVVTGGEWGEGRRASMIGSYMLSCIDPATGDYHSIGRVGTGISDEMLNELTARFKDIILIQNGKELTFIPQIVFEVGFEEIQKSQTYDSGYALRFPRLVRVRDDKSADEIDNIERIEQLYINQKGRASSS